MTGFKEGASSDDPFLSEPLEVEEEEGDEEEENVESATTQVSTSDLDGLKEGGNETTSSSGASGGLPWIYDRDSITDGRAKTVQLHLQESTLDEQRKIKSVIEADLGESIKKADLREAALLIGFQHLDEVGDQLREWGYDFD